MSNFYTRTAIEIDLKVDGSENVTKFFQRPVLAREHHQLTRVYNQLNAEKRFEAEHQYNVDIISKTAMRPPENLPFFDPARQNLADYLTKTSDEELEQIKAAIKAEGENPPDDETLRQLQNDKKVILAKLLFNLYNQEIANPFF